MGDVGRRALVRQIGRERGARGKAQQHPARSAASTSVIATAGAAIMPIVLVICLGLLEASL